MKTVGQEGDAFRVPHSERSHEATLGRLSQVVQPSDTLLVMPQGVLYNYLLRVRSPTSHISFMPFEFALTGEERILADLEANPPDYVLWVDRDVEEYGFRRFGQSGYGSGILVWLREGYDWQTPPVPGEPLLLKRRESRSR